ncbi:transposable element Tc1 transposase [Trichonephila clavipes]|uniref:Transposable element Tc1 transposase n=1 Tax=Trichonephila clavipes TaxID=2585209 RepID=A0A8X6S933_TRICX|nr:transposable element Tc1 transposase [Trichonephila clavipes]
MADCEVEGTIASPLCIPPESAMSPTEERRDEGGNIRTRQNPLGPQERQTRISKAPSIYESTIDQCSPSGRLDWAREPRDWSVEDWKRVAWSDESLIRLLKADGRLRIWRQAHEAMDPACQVRTVQGHGGSIMDRGVFSWHCLGSLMRVPTSLNAIWYVELLGDHHRPFMLICFSAR